MPIMAWRLRRLQDDPSSVPGPALPMMTLNRYEKILHLGAVDSLRHTVRYRCGCLKMIMSLGASGAAPSSKQHENQVFNDWDKSGECSPL